jgi:hypothetical protein
MGGYGHAQLRDFMLGGATQGVLIDLRRPVCFCCIEQRPTRRAGEHAETRYYFPRLVWQHPWIERQMLNLYVRSLPGSPCECRAVPLS